MKHNNYDGKVASLMADLASNDDISPEKQSEKVKFNYKSRATAALLALIVLLLGFAIWQVSQPPEFIVSKFDY